MTALSQNKLAEAEQALSAIADLQQTQCPAALLARGRLLAAQGKAEEAEKFLSRFIEADPNSPEGPFSLGTVLLREGRYPQADAMADLALAKDPEHAGALALKGQLLGMKGQPEEGRRLLERAIRNDPKNAEAHFQMGVWFDRRKESANAAAEFEKAIAAQPWNPRAYDYAALNWERLGETGKAENAYKQGLRVNSGPLFDSFLNFNYGRFLLKQNRLDESRQHLDRGVELVPGVRAVVYERAKVNLRKGRLEEARQDAEQALSIADPGGIILDLQVYYLLSEVYARLGQKEQADKYSQLAKTAVIPPKARERK